MGRWDDHEARECKFDLYTAIQRVSVCVYIVSPMYLSSIDVAILAFDNGIEVLTLVNHKALLIAVVRKKRLRLISAFFFLILLLLANRAKLFG